MQQKEFYNYIVFENGEIYSNYVHRFLNPDITKHGYKQVTLYVNRNPTRIKVHRLVALLWLENPPKDKPTINHKDGNKKNNHVNNLEWVTPQENCRHAWDNGLAFPSYGMKGKHNPNGGRKGIPFEIVETGKTYNTAMECAKDIDGNHRHINDCLKGRQKTHRGYHFRYI